MLDADSRQHIVASKHRPTPGVAAVSTSNPGRRSRFTRSLHGTLWPAVVRHAGLAPIVGMYLPVTL